MSLSHHSAARAITGVEGLPVPMPESLLLRRLSFTLYSAVETLTELLLSCESHISHSPRTPRPSRKHSLPIPPGSPTSIRAHISSPISLLDVGDALTPSLDAEKSTSRRKRRSRSNIPKRAPHPSSQRRPKTSTSPKNEKHSRHPYRLQRRNSHSRKPNSQENLRQRQEKRLRTTTRRPQELAPSSNEPLAFVQPPPTRLVGGLHPFYAQRGNSRRAPPLRSQQRIPPQPPVASIALPSTVTEVPKGALTSLLSNGDAPLCSVLKRGHKPLEAREKSLEQGIRPSRRVRFSQNVQLVF